MLKEKVSEIWMPIAVWFDDNVIRPVLEFFSGLANGIVKFFQNTWSSIVLAWITVSTWFDVNVIQPILEFFIELTDSISQFFENAWNAIISTWITASTWFNYNVIEPIVNHFTGLIGSITTIGESISQALKDMFCKPIDWIQEKWGAVKGFFSGMLGQASEIASKGQSVTGLTSMNIPGYATGTNWTPNTFIAGENGPELITNGAGRKVFTAAETGTIFNNLNRFQNIFRTQEGKTETTFSTLNKFENIFDIQGEISYCR